MFAARRLFIAVVAAGSLLLAGCGAQVGNAAVVDGTAISVTDLFAQTEQVAGVPSGTMATQRLETDTLAVTNRALLSREVQHELLVRAGLAVTATPEQLSQLEQQYGLDYLYKQLQATPDTLAERVGDIVAFEQLVTAAVDAGTGIQGPVVDVDLVSFPTFAEGRSAYNRYLIDPAAMTTEFDAHSGQSGTLAIPGQSGAIPVGVFSVPAGTLLLLPAANDSANIARVTQVRTADQGVTSSSLSQLVPADYAALGAMLLGQQLAASDAADSDVQVNPRFGVWDEDLLQVVADTRSA